jgi:hypothetical protein
MIKNALMSRRYIWFIILSAIVLLLQPACEENDQSQQINTEDEDTDSDTPFNTVNYAGDIEDAMAQNCSINEDMEDYIWDDSQVVHIVLNRNSASVDGEGASVNGSVITIASAGTYNLSGTLDDGQVIVNTEDDDVVRLILNGVDIYNSTSAPVYVIKADKVVIILADNNQNSLTDASSYIYENVDEDEPNATLFSKSDLSFYGNGTLIVNGNYNDGIAGKDGLIVKSGNIVVNSVDDGIRGKDYLILEDGNITINAGGDGLKSDNEEDSTKGYIFIEKGTLNITSIGDALTAQTDALIAYGELNLVSGGGSSSNAGTSVSSKGIKGLVNTIIEGGNIAINSADDAIHSNGNFVVNGGSLILSSGDDGIHADGAITINSGDIAITTSYEGIESSSITINDGTVNITARDDGFNASKGNGGETNDLSTLHLKGGKIVVNSVQGDGLDSNGSIIISGGTIVVHGPQSNPEVGMDYNGTCNITGGFVVISGTNSNMTQGPSTSSTQYSLKLITTTVNTAGTLFHIQDASGSNLITFKPLRSYYSVVFSSPDLKNGAAYSVYIGGTSTGTDENGLLTGGTYTPGSLYTSFTISGIVTNIGNGGQGPPSGGP